MVDCLPGWLAAWLTAGLSAEPPTGSHRRHSTRRTGSLSGNDLISSVRSCFQAVFSQWDAFSAAAAAACCCCCFFFFSSILRLRVPAFRSVSWPTSTGQSPTPWSFQSNSIQLLDKRVDSIEKRRKNVSRKQEPESSSVMFRGISMQRSPCSAFPVLFLVRLTRWRPL